MQLCVKIKGAVTECRCARHKRRLRERRRAKTKKVVESGIERKASEMEEESYNEAVENRESRGLAGYASVSQSVSYFAVPPPARSLHPPARHRLAVTSIRAQLRLTQCLMSARLWYCTAFSQSPTRLDTRVHCSLSSGIVG